VVREHDPSAAEDEAERNSRRLLELLQEMRVATAGVQILFGFLLAVPFQQGFERVSSFERHTYLVVLICTALSAALLIAPTSMHRLLFRRGQKPEIIEYANRMVIGGLVLLALAMIGVVLLLTHVIFGAAAAIAVTVPVALVFASTWFAIPLRRRGRRL
jgi:O-antigen/teichoic acid export membrane protein